MDAKTEYTFRAAWLDGMDELTPTEELMLRRMIDEYALQRIEPSPLVLRTSSALLRLKWGEIQRSLSLSYVRSMAGKKGGAPAGNQNAVKQHDSEEQKQAKTSKNQAKKTSKNNQNSSKKQAKTSKNQAKSAEEAEKTSKNKQNPHARVIDTTNNNNDIIITHTLSAHTGACEEAPAAPAPAADPPPYMPPDWAGYNPPSEEEVMSAANQLFITEDVALQFYLKYTSQNWTFQTASGHTQPIRNWRAKLREFNIYQQKNERTTTANTNAGAAGDAAAQRTRQLAEQTYDILRDAAAGKGTQCSDDILFD